MDNMDKMGRLHYGIQLSLMYIISFAISYFANLDHLGPSIILWLLLVMPYTIIITIRRLNDINKSAWLAPLLIAVPVSLIILAFIPGTSGETNNELGRMRRLHYGLHFIAIFFIYFICLFVDKAGQYSGFPAIVDLLLMCGYIGTIIYSIIIAIKRFHDMDKSGWWALLTLLPLVSIIIIFIPGTKGSNRFGEDPKVLK